MDLVDAFNQAGVFAKLSLLVGVGPPGLAMYYAARPTERTLLVMRPVSLAAIFAAIGGLTAGLIATLTHTAARLPEPINLASVYLGLAESLVAPLFNFGLLAVAWLLVAIGMARGRRAE
jgi:hypothetical protein